MKPWAVCFSLLFALAAATPARAEPAADLYRAQAIVTGTGERNRQPGFRDCLERVVLRVSGDQRLLAKPEMTALRAQAGRFVQSFTYRDRLAGKPVHDEQGTHDRPHDLTCHYDRAVIDRLLADLGSHPWVDRRPVMAVFLEVKRDTQHYRINGEDARDEAMREAFVQAASPLAMTVAFPSAKDVAIDPREPSLGQITAKTGADLPLLGTLVWSDPDLGWVANWTLRQGNTDHRWQVKGVNFDEAFRVAMRGAAQILSGNGDP